MTGRNVPGGRTGAGSGQAGAAERPQDIRRIFRHLGRAVNRGRGRSAKEGETGPAEAGRCRRGRAQGVTRGVSCVPLRCPAFSGRRGFPQHASEPPGPGNGAPGGLFRVSSWRSPVSSAFLSLSRVAVLSSLTGGKTRAPCSGAGRRGHGAARRASVASVPRLPQRFPAFLRVSPALHGASFPGIRSAGRVPCGALPVFSCRGAA